MPMESIKTFMQVDSDGEIGAVVTTNDPTLIIEPDMIDITKYKDCDKIKQKNHHFKLKNGKITEKTAAEKADSDERSRPKQKEDPILSILADIQNRLTAVESALAVKKPKA